MSLTGTYGSRHFTTIVPGRQVSSSALLLPPGLVVFAEWALPRTLEDELGPSSKSYIKSAARLAILAETPKPVVDDENRVSVRSTARPVLLRGSRIDHDDILRLHSVWRSTYISAPRWRATTWTSIIQLSALLYPCINTMSQWTHLSMRL